MSNVEYQRWDELYYCLDQMMHRTRSYLKFIMIHMKPGRMGMFHRMHGASGEVGYKRFLPWHRALLIEFENEMRKHVPDITMPYWDWEADQGQLVGMEILDRLNDTRKIWTRDPYHTFPIKHKEVLDLVNNVDTYFEFSKELERGPHLQGHNWAGGSMMRMMNSPEDPLFYFHHANVDRWWFEWQKKNPGERASLRNPDNLLDPWGDKYTTENIDDIIQLGPNSYIYD